MLGLTKKILVYTTYEKDKRNGCSWTTGEDNETKLKLP